MLHSYNKILILCKIVQLMLYFMYGYVIRTDSVTLHSMLLKKEERLGLVQFDLANTIIHYTVSACYV